MASPVHWQVPAIDHDERLVGGAAELGLDPLWVRLGFLILFAAGGLGGLLYLVLWGGLALTHYLGHGPTQPPRPKVSSERRRLIGFGLVLGGFAALLFPLGGAPADLVWPVGVLAAGILLALRRLSPDDTSFLPRWFPGPQLIGGIVAALGVVAIVQAADVGLGSNPIVITAAVIVGFVVLSAPWWWRLVTELDAERQARIRSDERADVAAHLHDSVLQTLALIQKGDDPQQMVSLARRQERELRNWLDPQRASRVGGSIRGQLDEMASDVEELHGVPVEVVCVGDALVDRRIEAALAAAREATVNSAKHSNAEKIDLYAEVAEDTIEIFVRDTGAGFDADAVDADRRGVRESIVHRMERVGGVATVHTAPGEGTEVELMLPRAEVSS